jgi:imidazolonepropionase-like amidohydrolase
MRTVGLMILGLMASLGGTVQAAAVLYEGERLIVDARRPPIDPGAILVENGKITKMGKMGTVPFPPDVVRVDWTGKVVMPALIDTHIHIGYQNADLKDASYAAGNYTRENLNDQLRRYAYAGVALVMSLGTDPGMLPFQIQTQQDLRGGTQLRLAGRGMAAPDAGPGDAALKPSAYSLTSVEEARKAVRDEVAKKVDFIKVWVDDRNGAVKKTPPEIYRAIIQEAHKANTRVIAHVFYLDDAKDLVRSGIDGFAHLVRDQEVDEEFIALVKQRNIFLKPNMGIAALRTETNPAFLNDQLYRDVTPEPIINRVRAAAAARTPEALDAARRTYAILRANLAKLNAAGARIGFGTDSGAVPDYYHAYNAHRELQLMVEAGMTPQQALTAATATSAEFLRGAALGTLNPNRSADFLVLDADPLEDIRNTERISAVYLRGVEVDRKTPPGSVVPKAAPAKPTSPTPAPAKPAQATRKK